MHSTTVSTTNSKTSSTSTTNIQQYHYPPISTLRRASRPSNIDLSLFDHNHTQQANDPAIYSAPIYIKQPNNNQHPQQHIPQTSHPYTASYQYQPQQEQHIQVPSQHHNIHLYQQPQQQQQPIIHSYSHHQHTPHTFPLQGSPNHNNQFFYFPPSTLQVI